MRAVLPSLEDREAGHDAVWTRFTSAPQTLPPERSAMLEWHKGRSWYAVWMYRFRQEALSQRMAAILASMQALVPIYPVSEPHLTVFVAGFPCTKARFADDVEEQLLKEQIRALTVSQFEAPLIQVGSANSMLTGSMLEAVDLTPTTFRVRHVLARQSQEIRFSLYVPHITIGHYLKAVPPIGIAERLQPWKDLAPLRLCPYALELVYFRATTPVSQDIPLCQEHFHTVARIPFLL